MVQDSPVVKLMEDAKRDLHGRLWGTVNALMAYLREQDESLLGPASLACESGMAAAEEYRDLSRRLSEAVASGNCKVTPFTASSKAVSKN